MVLEILLQDDSAFHEYCLYELELCDDITKLGTDNILKFIRHNFMDEN